ncbi:hypothetical protein SAMN04489844_3895 [Nocardioides exalbidus]|uniref:Uncharacterized protein n=1 Tax=Nocardioides exalbidus TaxID=402596 RepID=A0A1H4YS56_9ACTN|nr:hypothetical protein [Nocardioides exalbidus]SED19871.1 hypothetical protein SAMN04489844_3895 [Nocardioides exalbidus]
MDTPRTSPRLAALVVVLATPPLAWLLWISSADGTPSDARHVAWFATVALGCVVAGALAGTRSRLWLPAVSGVASAVVTLYLWWSSEDETGLFMVGIIIATPLMLVASLPLLLIGRAAASVGHVSE